MRQIEELIFPLVKAQFPDFYQDEGPRFISFVKEYYRWMEAEGEALNASRNLLDYRNIDSTSSDFIKYFKNKYLSGVPLSTEANTQLVIKHALDIYKAKGTERGVQLLIQGLFNEESRVVFPGQDIFKTSDGVWIKPTYLELTVKERTQSFVGQEIVGSRSGAKAFLESLVTKRLSGKYQQVAYLSSVRGNFETGELITTSSNTSFENAPTVIGSMTSLTVVDGGANFAVGDIFEVTSTNGKQGKARVTEVSNETGRVTFIYVDAFTSGGWGYSIDHANVIVSDKVLTLTNIVNANGLITDFSQFETVTQPLANIGYSTARGNNYYFNVGNIIENYNSNGDVVANAVIAVTSKTTNAVGWIIVVPNVGNIAAQDTTFAVRSQDPDESSFNPSTIGFAENTYTSVYSKTYSNLFTGSFSQVFTSIYTSDYTGVYGTVYSSAYTQEYSSTYSRVFTSDSYLGNYSKTFTSEVYTGTYSRVFTTSGTTNFSGSYLQYYIVTTPYTGSAYTTAFTGAYTAVGFTGLYNLIYTGDYTKTFTSEFQGTLVPGFYTGTYSGSYAGSYVGYFTGTRVTPFGNVPYSTSYINYFLGSYVGGYQGVYQSAYQNPYSGATFAANVNSYNLPNYVSNFSRAYTGGFISYPVYTGLKSLPYGGVPGVTEGYVGAGYTGAYITSYSSIYSGAYGGDSFSRIFTGLYQLGSFTGNFTSTFTGNFSGSYGTAYTGTYSDTFTNDYVGSFSRTFQGDFTTSYTTSYTGLYNVFSGAYTSTYSQAFTAFTGAYTGFTGSYSLAFSGNYNAFSGQYLSFSLSFGGYSSAFSGVYNNSFTSGYGGYTGIFTRTYTSAQGTANGVIVQYFSKAYTGLYAGSDYTSAFNGYTRTFTVTLAGAFTSSYSGQFTGAYIGYTGTYLARTYTGSYGAYSGAYQDSLFTGNYGFFTGAFGVAYTGLFIGSGSTRINTLTAHEFSNNDIVRYHVMPGNTYIPELSIGAAYYIVNAVPGSTSLYLSHTPGGAPISLTRGSNETGHRLIRTLGTAVITFYGDRTATGNVNGSNTSTLVYSFNAQTSVSSAGDTITIPSHQLENNYVISYSVSAGNTQLDGLINNTKYYVVNTTASTIQLSATRGGSPLGISASNRSENGHFITHTTGFVGVVDISVNGFVASAQTYIRGSTSNTTASVANVSTGSGAGFSIGLLTDTESVLLSPDFIDGKNTGNVKFSEIKLNGIGSNVTAGGYGTAATFNGNTDITEGANGTGVLLPSRVEFNALSGVNNTTNIITISSPAKHIFSNNEQVKYLVTPGNTAVTGLANNTNYYVVNAIAGSTTLQLSLTSGGSPIDITSTANEVGHSLTRQATTGSNNSIALSTAVNYLPNSAVHYSLSAANTSINGLTPNTVYYVDQSNATHITLKDSPTGLRINILKGPTESGHTLFGPLRIITGANSTYDNVGSGEEIFRGLGFIKFPGTNLDTILLDALRFDSTTIGSIASLVSINPGADYNVDPFVTVVDTYVVGYDSRDYVMQINTTVGAFVVGEQIQQSYSNVATQLTVTGFTGTAANGVGTSTFIINEFVYQSNSTANVAASGYVVEAAISAGAGTLKVKNVTGTFVNNAPSYPLKGLSSGSTSNVTLVTPTTLATTARALVKSANSSVLKLKRINLENTFLDGNPIIGRSSGATANVVGVVEDANAVPVGLNASIEANVQTANNVVKKLAVADSGFGYLDREPVTLTMSNSAFSVTAVVELGKQGVGQGYYGSTRGFLSDDKKLQDSEFYQEYSYEVQTKVPFDRYFDVLKRVTHVAGTKAFGRVISLSLANLEMTAINTIETSNT
jgi:hypothetical protein